ncbi:helix-turn-helix domain-containing protein [Glycocaulis sp.]
MDRETGEIGSAFGDFLKEEGRYEDATVTAVKRVLAFQLAEAMKEQNITKVEMARQLSTSRSQLDRLLDPENDAVTLGALARAAAILGRKVSVELV